MYAIVRTGGKQYKVRPGDKFTVEKLEGEKGAKFTISDVLLISEENDAEPIIGKPVIENAKVDCEIVSQARSKKIIVFKFKKRKRYMRNKGHRQELTMLKVGDISCSGKTWKAEARAEETTVVKKVVKKAVEKTTEKTAEKKPAEKKAHADVHKEGGK